LKNDLSLKENSDIFRMADFIEKSYWRMKKKMNNFLQKANKTFIKSALHFNRRTIIRG